MAVNKTFRAMDPWEVHPIFNFFTFGVIPWQQLLTPNTKGLSLLEANIPKFLAVTAYDPTFPTYDNLKFCCIHIKNSPNERALGSKRVKEDIVFCSVDILSSRCQNVDRRKEDYEFLKANGTPFQLSTNKGEFFATYPPTLIVAPDISESFDVWDKKQRERWHACAIAAATPIPKATPHIFPISTSLQTSMCSIESTVMLSLKF
ncbi:hypothetical protein M422DRAFT_62910 [Sphaerobolus stellatus SS14]|nr:hypothetical protein M422DRAFT_62910 [Sphaerobolus stellatus SS14]